MEQCKDSLQIPALIPEVHRYIFFSSRGFIMILAMVSGFMPQNNLLYSEKVKRKSRTITTRISEYCDQAVRSAGITD